MKWHKARVCCRKMVLITLAFICVFALSCPLCLTIAFSQSVREAFAEVPNSQYIEPVDISDFVEPVDISDFAVSAQLMWMNPSTGRFEECDPSKVLIAGSTANFNVQITFSDGSTVSASEIGLDITWSLEGNIYGGVKVASMSSKGVLELTGAQTKVVCVSASFVPSQMLQIQGSRAFVSLSKSVEASAVDGEISSVSIDYSASSSGTWNPTVPGIVNIPKIATAGGILSTEAQVKYSRSDSSAETEKADSLQNALLWQASAFYDEEGSCSNTILANVSTSKSQGSLSANQAGNGWVILRCSSLLHPEFCGQEIPVRILNNGSEESLVYIDSSNSFLANSVKSAQLVYRTEKEKYQIYSGSAFVTPTIIDAPFGSVLFDVLLTFEDGSSARAAERGVAADWRLRGRVTGDTAIARWYADGTLRATHAGNDTIRISNVTLGTKSVSGTTAYIVVKNNSAGISPKGNALDISARSRYWTTIFAKPDESESWYWRSEETSGTEQQSRPLVQASSEGAVISTCTLAAQVRWFDSSITGSLAQDGAERTWSVASSRDASGEACEQLATVDSNGVVRPTGKGSGFATIACTALVPYYDESGNRVYAEMKGEIVVAVFKSQSAIDRLVILNKEGEEFTTSSLVLPDGVETYQFYVKAIMRDGSTVSNVPSASDYNADFFSSLEWVVTRSEDGKEAELYSEVNSQGKFHSLKAFARGYVHATLKGAAFTGGDLSCGMLLIAESSTESVGQSDSLDVKIYHYSDYKNHGEDQKPAKRIMLSRSQLQSMCDYITWYSFLKSNLGGKDSFGTWYAKGITMQNLLMACGVDKGSLVAMSFTGSDGYAFNERHSAEFILGSQYRYTNFYYRSKIPRMVKQSSVAPMLALSFYQKNNGGFEDVTGDESIKYANNAGNAGFNYMGEDSTFRVIFGMKEPNTPNASMSVIGVNALVVIIKDAPVSKKEEDTNIDKDEDKDKYKENPKVPEKKPDNKSKDSWKEINKPSDKVPPHKPFEKRPSYSFDLNNLNKLTPNGRNPEKNGEKEDGVGLDYKQGQQVSVSETNQKVEVGHLDATNSVADDTGAHAGMETGNIPQNEPKEIKEVMLREMVNARKIVPPTEIDDMYWMITGASVGSTFVVGSIVVGWRFRRDWLDGKVLSKWREIIDGK